MKTTLRTLAIGLVALVCLTACEPAQKSATNIGFHQTLPKAGARAEDWRRFPPRDLCTAGVLNPVRRGSLLEAPTSMACQDGDGYKVVYQRYVARIYARRAAWLDWHRYSRDLTVESQNWEGGMAAVVSDVCHYPGGFNWYEVRLSGAAVFSQPTRGGLRTTEHYHDRLRSTRRIPCGPRE